MSGFALEPAGLYGIEEINRRTKLAPTDKKYINPENIKGVIIRVKREVFPHIVSHIEPILTKLGHGGHWTTGSAGSWHEKHPWFKLGSIKQDTGDIDVHVNAAKLTKALGLKKDADEKAIRAALAQNLKQHFPAVTQTGEQVHVAYPAGQTVHIPEADNDIPAYYQVDFPTTFNADTTYRHHEHEYAKPYQWDGQDQQLAMASLVNSMPNEPEKTHLYHGFGGALKHRSTGEVKERDIDAIAKKVFNDPKASQEWTATVDRILSHLPDGINNPRLAQFRADMQKKYPDRALQEGTVDWFKAISQKLRI